MKNRKMLGRNGDLSDIIAATKPDPYATRRIYAACDWEYHNSHEEAAYRKLQRRVNDAVQKVKRKMGKKYADVAGAYLRGQNWSHIGIPERTFQHRLKKVKIFFEA